VTIRARVGVARQHLRDAGVSDAESDLDARLLAQHVLGWSTERFYTESGDAEPADFAVRYDTLVARRSTREPLAYIVGRREFWGLDFEVTPAVLIPRPSTELIVEAALELFPDRTERTAIADVCCGSGCVAVAVARERPSASVIASDISLEALDVARRNAVHHGVADRVSFRHADLVAGIDKPLDAILANPPYVLDNSGPALSPEVRDHEPALALFGGADGLTLVRRLVADAPARLKPGGYLIMEFGLGQDVEIDTLIAESPELTEAGIRRDIQGIARIVIARRT
jgi:release factor glutamine methyltransferase